MIIFRAIKLVLVQNTRESALVLRFTKTMNKISMSLSFSLTICGLVGLKLFQHKSSLHGTHMNTNRESNHILNGLQVALLTCKTG